MVSRRTARRCVPTRIMVLSLETSCKVFVRNAAAAQGWDGPKEPINWRNNRYSQEAWLAQAMQNHPWQTQHIADADIVLLAARFSQICTARKTYTARSMWHHQLNDSILCSGTAIGRSLWDSRGDPQCTVKTPPKLLVLSNTECPMPWEGWGGPYMPPSHLPPDYLLAVDRRKGTWTADRALVLPAVLASPRWLVSADSHSSATGDTQMPAAIRALTQTPWDSRRLLFFPGHIPKLYIA